MKYCYNLLFFHKISFFFIFLSINTYGQSVYFQNLEAKWKRNPKPEIAIKIARELIDEQTDKALYYVQEAQKFEKKDLEDDILLLLTEIYLRKHQDEKAKDFYQKLTQIYTTKKDTLNPKYLFIKSFWLSLRSRSYEAAQILEKYLQPIQASSVNNPDIAILYLEYAADLMRIRNYSKALDVLAIAEPIYERLNMQKYLGKLYNLRGLIYKNTNYLTLGIENYTKAIKIFRAYNPISRNLAVSYVNLANIYLLRSKDTFLVKEAEKVLLTGVNLCEQIKDTVQLIHFHERLGFLYLGQKNTNEAKSFFEKGFELSKLIGSSHLQNYNQIRLTDAYFQSGQKAEAVELLEKILQKVIQDKNNELISEATLLLVSFYQNLNKHDEAIKYTDFGIDISIKAQFSTNKAFFYDRKINSLIALQRWKDAQIVNDRLMKMFENDKAWLLKIYSFQKQIDSGNGNYLSALKWVDKYQILRDSLDNAEKIQNFYEARQRFFTEEKQRENDILRIQNEQERANNRRNVYFIVALGVLSVLLLLLASNWWIKQEKLKIINQQIITQEKQIRAFANQVAAANEFLTKKNEFDSKLLAIISHDLRGPVNSVATLLAMIKNGAFLEEEKPNLIALAHNSLFGAGQLLDNLLFWAKSYQSDFKINTKELSVKKVADEVIDLLKLQAEQKGIFIENRIQPDIVCWAEEEAVQLTIRNLVSNAIKFTKIGGISLEANYKDTNCQIIVKDTGIGIEPNNLSKIFDKTFYTKGTKREKGNGLGLMLCKEFIERNKGTISVSSQVGVGSIFTITLPKGKLQEKNQTELPEQSLL